MDTQQQKQSKVLLIGETCIDVHVYGKVNRLCPEAPAPVFNKMSSKENLGMAGNVSSNLNALNVSHDFLTNSNFESVKKIRYVCLNLIHQRLITRNVKKNIFLVLKLGTILMN